MTIFFEKDRKSTTWMKKLIERIFGKKDVKIRTRQDQEREQLSNYVRGQFLKLKEKGLSIPVFTL